MSCHRRLKSWIFYDILCFVFFPISAGDVGSAKLMTRIMYYPLVLVVCFLPASINRVVEVFLMPQLNSDNPSQRLNTYIFIMTCTFDEYSPETLYESKTYFHLFCWHVMITTSHHISFSPDITSYPLYSTSCILHKFIRSLQCNSIR